MDFRKLLHFLNLRDFRNAFIGFITVSGGLALAGLTVWSHRTGNVQLAGIAAAASLVFVLLILIFVVPPLARNASEEASQMNLPLDLTLGGVFMLGLLAIVGFAAWNTGNNLLFLVFSFLVALLAVSFFLGVLVIRGIDVKMRFPETVFADEETPILLTLVNRKRLMPALSILLEVRGTERERTSMTEEVAKILPRGIAERLTRPPVVKHTLDYFLYVPRRGEVESRTKKTFPFRGRFIIRDFELSTKFPFGFFRHRRRLTASQAEIVVFPKPAEMAPELRELGVESGSTVSSRRGSGQDLLALRGYESGDDMRRVDWKATARSGSLTVREFAADDDRRVLVALDSRVRRPDGAPESNLRQRVERQRSGKPSEPESDKFEQCASIAAGVLVHFGSEQSELRLLIDDEDSGYGSGKGHLHECLRRLALAGPRFLEEGGSAESSVDRGILSDDARSSHVFLISSEPITEIPPDIHLINV